MKTFVRTVLAVAVVSTSVWAGGCQVNGGKPTEKQVAASQKKLDALPAPARLAVSREFPGSVVKKAYEDEGLGRAVYAIELLTAEGKDAELRVTGDGRLLYREVEEETVKFAALPDAVKRAATAHTGGAKITEADRKTVGGVEQYEVEAILAGVEHELTFDATGTLVREEIEINPEQLPAAVKSALRARFPDVSVTKAEEIRQAGAISYEVEGKKGTRHVEAVLTPTGEFVSVRTR